MRDRKYKYLYQLIFTGMILVVVPTLLYYNLVWKKSFQEIKRLNANYYNNSADAFLSSFLSEVAEFRERINTFSADSRYSEMDAGVFFHGTEKMEKKVYYYSEAIHDLSQYIQTLGYDNIGIFYYEKNLILTNRSKYTLERYIKDWLQIDDNRKGSLINFFSRDLFKKGNTILIPLYDSEGKSEELLVGICTILGKNREEALIFYQINYEDIDFLCASVQGGRNEKYYIVDNVTQEVIFSVGATIDDYMLLREEISNTRDFSAQTESSRFFKKQNESLDITFFVDSSGDRVQNNVARFYCDVKLFFLYIFLVLMVVCFGTVYINYKPVHRLLGKIRHRGKGEFEMFRHAWEEQQELLTKQRMTIMDLLMNHLLYGIPISRKHVINLGVSDKITRYCVFVVDKYVLKVAEVEEVTKKVEDLFGTLLFATDFVEEKAMVLIAFMEDDRAIEIKAWLEEWCLHNIEDDCQLRMGKVVNQLDEIKISFANCVEDSNTSKDVNEMNGIVVDTRTVSEKVRNRAIINEKLQEKMLNYIDENFTDKNICQQMVADYFQISVYSVSKMFNNQIGTGFSEYINSKRIEYAKELLISNKKTIKEIAGMVGVSDVSYFTKVFKKYTGVLPAEFRDDYKD